MVPGALDAGGSAAGAFAGRGQASAILETIIAFFAKSRPDLPIQLFSLGRFGDMGKMQGDFLFPDAQSLGKFPLIHGFALQGANHLLTQSAQCRRLVSVLGPGDSLRPAMRPVKWGFGSATGAPLLCRAVMSGCSPGRLPMGRRKGPQCLPKAPADENRRASGVCSGSIPTVF